MRLYHASNMAVRMPKIIPSNRMLDFGMGFYTTTCREQAVRFAYSVARRRGGVPTLNTYFFDETVAESDCAVLRFEGPTEEWLDFVAANRTGTYRGSRYDLIVGPVANDSVYATLGLYISGILSKTAAIAELRVRKLYDQYVFCSPNLLQGLVFEREEVV